MNTEIHYSRLENLAEITKIHALCFPQSLPVQMGNKFSSKTLEWHLSGNNRFMIHVTFEGKPVAYLGCFIPEYEGDGSTSGIIKYAFLQSFGSFILKPHLLFDERIMKLYPLIFKNIYSRIFKKKNKIFDHRNLIPEKDRKLKVVVIGIDPSFRHKGIVDSIFQFLESLAIQNKYPAIALSVKKSNSRAINAYIRNGLSIEKEGNDFLEMKKIIKSVEETSIASSGNFC